jgi:hypothetical protein
VVLSGQVETPDRCAAIERRIRAEAPGCRIVNEIAVVSTSRPDGAEPLS